MSGKAITIDEVRLLYRGDQWLMYVPQAWWKHLVCWLTRHRIFNPWKPAIVRVGGYKSGGAQGFISDIDYEIKTR